MKKTILVVILTTLGAFVSLKAQVGIGQEVPQATLHVDGNNTATDPSGVIVPRFTASALNDKNAAYGAAQNGTIVFVTSGTGVAATKTSEITGTGFYYYNSTTSKWTAVGGGNSTAVYQNILGEAVAVNAASYNALPTDYLIRTTFGSAVSIVLPNASASNKGKVYAVYNNNTVASTVTVSSNSVLGTPTLSINRGKMFISDGANWVSMTYN